MLWAWAAPRPSPPGGCPLPLISPANAGPMLTTVSSDQKNRPKSIIVPGKAQVSFKEWVVPSLGSRPHDPLSTPDGAIWWTGQWANVLGRLDPKTGAMKEFPLKTPQSGPHGLVADKSGNIWYTGNSKAHVGKLDPTTGAVTEYPMPDAVSPENFWPDTPR